MQTNLALRICWIGMILAECWAAAPAKPLKRLFSVTFKRSWAFHRFKNWSRKPFLSSLWLCTSSRRSSSLWIQIRCHQTRSVVAKSWLNLHLDWTSCLDCPTDAQDSTKSSHSALTLAVGSWLTLAPNRIPQVPRANGKAINFTKLSKSQSL